MKSIETCRECRRNGGAHLLTCQTFARQANATLANRRGNKDRPKAGKEGRR